MKNKFSFALLLLAGLSVSSCKTPCDSPGSIPSLISNVVVTKWACTNPTKVQADISATCSKLGFCQVGQTEGIIASIACPLIVEEIRKLAANQVPPAWGCNPDNVGSTFATGLTVLCEMIPF